MGHVFMAGATKYALVIVQAVFIGICFRFVTEGTLSSGNGAMHNLSLHACQIRMTLLRCTGGGTFCVGHIFFLCYKRVHTFRGTPEQRKKHHKTDNI
jgi:hypothetical protein